MNAQEKQYFESLHKDRSESADMLEKPSMRGIKNSVVEKYSDQAHFIYELLQNADDAHATTARFVLERDRLIFAHNGTRHFSVSNPATEDADSENGTLGDINAITSIANSNKTEASIGKFGVGFKAVFQYTSTPHIYGPAFKFRIDRFIVPSLLEGDINERKAEETLFVFPFDHPERNAEEAYRDISDKLRNLSFPLLFLSKLKNIEFEFENVLGLYGKEIVTSRLFDDTIAEHIRLTQNNGDDLYDENLWLFSRTDDLNRRYDFFYTEILTGMRAGEICGVRWEDFDEDDRTLRVVRSVDFVHKELVIGETKTEDCKRTIYLPDSLWRLLSERKKKSFSEWIFPNLLKPELPLDPSKAYRQLKAILKKGNLPDIRFHDLRHTFTSHAANSGIAPKTLSEIVGHSKASFTLDHYAHVTSDMQKNAANIVTNYITDILGKELKPWQNAEKQAKGH